MSKDQRRAQTKKALLDALVICLEDQDFNDITTIRLVQTAGISRSSFYTHYKDKYDMTNIQSLILETSTLIFVHYCHW